MKMIRSGASLKMLPFNADKLMVDIIESYAILIV